MGASRIDVSIELGSPLLLERVPRTRQMSPSRTLQTLLVLHTNRSAMHFGSVGRSLASRRNKLLKRSA